MSRLLRSALLLIAVLSLLPLAFAQTDRENCKDYPGITRMPGFYIDTCDQAVFDAGEFPTKKGGETKQTVEGHRYNFGYQMKEGAAPTSKLQIVRNHENAAKSAGGQVVYEEIGGNWAGATFKITKGAKEVWGYVEARDDSYSLLIVEKKAMQQEVTANFKAISDDLAATGKAAIYGIYFDTGKAELKAESTPALEQIAQLLKQTPTLRVYIVGHTDMVGDAAANLRLSQARAQAVVTALTTKYAIAGTRLIAFGNGPYAPVAGNKSEEGRAKNRRVELVEIATN